MRIDVINAFYGIVATKWRRIQLNTFTFGVSASSFLTIWTIQKLADDELLTYPRAELLNQIYM